MKVVYVLEEGALIESIEKVIKKYETKLRPSKTLYIECTLGGGITANFDTNPVNSYSRSLYLDAFEKLADKFEKDMIKALDGYDVKVDFGGLGVSIEVNL